MAQQLAVVRYLDATERVIATGPEMRAVMQGLVDDLAVEGARRAPKESGAGAGSIEGRVRRVPQGWEGRVAWARRHYYMYMQHEGWTDRAGRRHPGRPFLREAAAGRRDIR
jgi:hypothetical protein